MKKVITFIAVMSMLTVSLAGCGKVANSDTDLSSLLESGILESGVTDDDVISDNDDTNLDSDIIDGDSTEESKDDIIDDAESIVSDIGEAVAHPFKKFIDPILEKAEDLDIPMLTEVTDKEQIKDFFKLDTENANYKDIIVMQSPMSGTLSEIIVIEANDGKIDDVKNDLETRKAKLIETDAYYPDHKTIAENAIINSSGNYVYLVAGNNPTEIEKELKTQLEK